MIGLMKSQIEYVEGEFDEQLRQKVEYIPYLYSYPDNGAWYFSGKILSCRWVSNKSAFEQGWIDKLDLNSEAPLVLRIDFSQLFIPSDFNPAEPERLERLTQHFFFLSEHLVPPDAPYYSPANSNFHLDWPEDDDFFDDQVELSLGQADLSAEELKSFLYEIENTLYDNVIEFLFDEGIPEGLSAPVEKLYRTFKEQAKVDL